MNITDLIAANPNATDAEIVAIANAPVYSSVSSLLVNRAVNGRVAELRQWFASLTESPVPGVSLDLLRQKWAEFDEGRTTLPTVDQADVPYMHVIASIVPDSVLPPDRKAIIAGLGVSTANVTADQVATIRRQPARDTLANRLARLSAAALAAFDAGADSPDVANLWSTIE